MPVIDHHVRKVILQDCNTIYEWLVTRFDFCQKRVSVAIITMTQSSGLEFESFCAYISDYQH